MTKYKQVQNWKVAMMNGIAMMTVINSQDEWNSHDEWLLLEDEGLFLFFLVQGAIIVTLILSWASPFNPFLQVKR